MPELPEVETTRRGVEPWAIGATLKAARVHNAALRWPVEIPETIIGSTVISLLRRGKYLLFRFDPGTLIVHLGMSGSLRVLTQDPPLLKHDHVEFVFERIDAPCVLRFNDPRRFGCIVYQPGDLPERHPLLAHLGVEPLGNEFSGESLFRLSRKRKVAVKNFIMDAKIVVGVGNIYASEALFMAGIRPTVPAGKVTRAAFDDLAASIRQVLSDAVRQGGTTLRDFVGSDGKPGYFKQSLRVYGRDGEACRVCESVLKGINVGNRSSVYCPVCQTRSGFRRPELGASSGY